jgi:hypothetical protein
VKKTAIILLYLGAFTLACVFVQGLSERISLSPTAPAQATLSQADLPTSIPTQGELSPTQAISGTSPPTSPPPSLPTETQPAEKGWDEASLREALENLMASPYWQNLGLPETLSQQWEAFAEGQAELSDSERQALEQFLSQWKLLNELAESKRVPAATKPGFRARETEGAGGEAQFVLYAVDEEATALDGAERLFLVAHNADGEASALLLAPSLEGLRQEASPDGKFVHYVNDQGVVVLIADARALNEEIRSEKQLKETLDEFYSRNDENRQASLYPRYRYLMEGTEAVFYALDKAITSKQIALLRDALDLFERPEFQPLKKELFGDQAAYIVSESISGSVVGLTYIGTGVVVLDRRSLFGNKYELASVIAHEGSHVLQGPLHGDPSCDIILAREIGEGKIPEDFYNWTAEELLKNLKLRKVGSYHVSLWMLHQLGVKDTAYLVEAIQTGKINGASIVSCK